MADTDSMPPGASYNDFFSPPPPAPKAPASPGATWLRPPVQQVPLVPHAPIHDAAAFSAMPIMTQPPAREQTINDLRSQKFMLPPMRAAMPQGPVPPGAAYQNAYQKYLDALQTAEPQWDRLNVLSLPPAVPSNGGFVMPFAAPNYSTGGTGNDTYQIRPLRT
jgi:hypothetical protein